MRPEADEPAGSHSSQPGHERSSVHPFSSFFNSMRKAPVGALGDDLLGARFDQAGLVQPQRVAAQGILHRSVGNLVGDIIGFADTPRKGRMSSRRNTARG